MWFRSKKSMSATTTAVAHSQPSLDLPIERRATEIGQELLDATARHRSGILSAKFWQDQLMDWAMKDDAFKVQLFRYVDVFPMLTTPEMVHGYLVDYLSQPGVTLPPGMGLGLKAGGLAKGLMAKTTAGRITDMAKTFIAGEDAMSTVPKLRKLWDAGACFTVDLLGEACVSDKEAEVYQQRYLDLVEQLPAEVASWPENPTLEADHLGAIPRTNVSIKISSLCARTDPIDFKGSLAALTDGLRPILEAAAKNNVAICFDIEQHSLKDLTFALFEKCCEEVDFPASVALQTYLKSADEDAEKLIAWSKKTGRQITVRLIKGAYWDYEVIHAEQAGWPVPVWPVKRMTDACFERVAERLVEQTPKTAGEGGIKLALGSHNLRSIAWTLAQFEKYDLPTSALEVQKLHGMGDELRAAAIERGLRVREYTPVGEMIPGMAYFVRRLLENTSNESWLRASADTSDSAKLLASPHVVPEDEPEHPEATIPTSDPMRHQLSPAVEGLGDGRPMENEPVHDFSIEQRRRVFADTIAATEVPAVDANITAEDAEKAIATAHKAFPAWRDMDAKERSGLIIKAAAIMREQRDRLSGIMVREAGKPWREADADTCEAIDFCEFYARCAVPLFEPRRMGKFIGELDHEWHQPRGVVSVISPWNFPLAICCGMTVAALSTGNTVIVKPSSQTRGIARAMCEMLWQAGVPRDVLHFLPGSGGTVGDLITTDPRVAMVAFTGSKEVGLRIWRNAGITPAEQGFLKHVVCEMGGKNAAIVDASADLDEAVLGVRQSAFGYCGQKCSACSRVIVVGDAYDRFLERIIESTKSLVIGDPMLPGTDFGPIIDESAARGIREYIEIGKTEGKLELACEVPAGLKEKVGKPYIAPHIFSGIRPEHRIAQEEIFGPVLAVMRAADFSEALDMANGVAYKLTGGVFSRKPEHLERARNEFRVGNLYLNRGITGAIVGRQPFGGFGMSGGGTKAGGLDYLLHFVHPRSCTENTMRHGFAPGLG